MGVPHLEFQYQFEFFWWVFPTWRTRTGTGTRHIASCHPVRHNKHPSNTHCNEWYTHYTEGGTELTLCYGNTLRAR